MERYDGKTRKDDIRKYTLIGVPIALLVIGFFVGLHFLKKAGAADYTVVVMCNGTLNEAAQADLEEAVKSAVGDANGNGRITVDFKEVMPAVFGGYDMTASALFTGDYVFFLILDPSQWGSDILAVKKNLSGTKFWKDLDTEMNVYGCILNTDETRMNEAKRILKALEKQGKEQDAAN